MLDKLVMTSSNTDLTKEKVYQLLQGQFSKCSITATKFHHSVLCFHSGSGKGEHLVSLHLHPRFSNTSELKIELNPNHFRDFSSLNDLVTKFADPSDLKLTRVDHAVDLEGFTVQDLRSRVIYSRKKSRKEYGIEFPDGVTLGTYYLGRPPEELLIYDKTPPEAPKGHFKTRVELQHYRGKVGISAYRNLANFQSINPFSSLKFKDLKRDVPESDLDRQKRASVLGLIGINGAQAAFKYLNKHSNFRRDFGHLFEDSPTIPELAPIYFENLRKFFNPTP